MIEFLIAHIPAILAGGAGLKLLEVFVLPRKTAIDVATELREELRGELKDNRQRLESLERAVVDWADKYTILSTEHQLLKGAHEVLKLRYDLLIEELTYLRRYLNEEQTRRLDAYLQGDQNEEKDADH